MGKINSNKILLGMFAEYCWLKAEIGNVLGSGCISAGKFVIILQHYLHILI
jgi:hypothetical protein